MSEDATPAHKGRYFVLFLLIIVYALNFLDRQILGILAVPIKTEFHLTDTQLGWLGGLAFGSVYSVLAIPAAWIADRYSRTWIMTAALAVWSGFTALCGLASGYGTLFIARMGVGVGEAGGVAPAYALISDYFPAGSRARALAVYSFGIPIGAAAGILFGGYIAKTIDWRFAFIAVGLSGVVIAPIFRLLVKEPPRTTPAEDTPGITAVARIAIAKPSFWLLSLAAGSTSLVGYGLTFWMPAYLVRTLGLDLVDAAKFLAAFTFLGGVIGIGLGGILADWLGRQTKAAYPLIPAIALTGAAICYALGILAHNPVEIFFLFLAGQILGLSWLGPVLTAVQHLGPPRARSQMSALCLLILNLIGLGLGPYIFGKLSDLLKPHYGADSLKWSVLACLGFYLVGAALLALAAPRLKKDWVD